MDPPPPFINRILLFCLLISLLAFIFIAPSLIKLWRHYVCTTLFKGQLATAQLVIYATLFSPLFPCPLKVPLCNMYQSFCILCGFGLFHCFCGERCPTVHKVVEKGDMTFIDGSAHKLKGNLILKS